MLTCLKSFNTLVIEQRHIATIHMVKANERNLLKL